MASLSRPARLGRFLFALAGAALLGRLVGCASRTPPPVRPVPPSEAKPGWIEEGVASWYGGNDGFEGKPTASGEIYDSEKMTAAHRRLPLGTLLEVVNVDNSRTVRVRINDRGPFVKGRIIDLSRAAARDLGILGPGTGTVRLSIVAPAPPAEAESEAPLSNGPNGQWAVQVGSFGEPGRAERHADRVRSTGRPVYLEPYRGLTRVKVGPYASREKAEETLARLEEAGFEGIVTPAEGKK